MQYQITTPSTVLIKAKVDYTPEEVNKAREAIIKDYAQGYKQDGYREGKVPAAIVEKRFEAEINNKALQTLINDAIDKIFIDNNYNPISKVRLEGQAKTLQANGAFDFECSFEILPPMELPDIENLEIDVLAPYLNPGEIEEVILSLRRNFAQFKDLAETRKVIANDVVRLDISTSYDGKEITSLSGKNLILRANPDDNFRVFDILKDMQAGDETKTTIKAPTDFFDQELLDKDLDLEIKVYSIQEEILPEFDDELAKKTKFESAEALKNAIFNNTMAKRIQEIKDQANNKLLKSLIDKLEFEIPETVLSAHVNDILYDTQAKLHARKLPAEQITKALEDMKPTAENLAKELAKAQCFLLTIADKYNLEVSEKEADNFLHKEALQAGQDPQKFKQQMWQSGAISDIRERLLADKAHDFLYSKAKKNVVDEKGNKVEAPNIE